MFIDENNSPQMLKPLSPMYRRRVWQNCGCSLPYDWSFKIYAGRNGAENSIDLLTIPLFDFTCLGTLSLHNCVVNLCVYITAPVFVSSLTKKKKRTRLESFNDMKPICFTTKSSSRWPDCHGIGWVCRRVARYGEADRSWCTESS